MATRTNTTIIDDAGFGQPIESGTRSGQDGTLKPESRIEEPKRNAPTIAGFETANPADIIDGGSGDGTPRKRRGRPPGSRNRTYAAEEKTPSNLIANLESILLSIHFMGAALLKTPELELSEVEAKKLSDALKNVAKHYTVNLDPKKLALVELSTTMVGVYGPRAIAIYKRGTPRPARSPVVEMTPKDAQPKTNAAPRTAQAPSELWNGEPIDDPPVQ